MNGNSAKLTSYLMLWSRLMHKSCGGERFNSLFVVQSSACLLTVEGGDSKLVNVTIKELYVLNLF